MSFEARYPARCPLCEDRIGPGDQVTYADDELVHVACESEPAREDDVDDPQRRVLLNVRNPNCQQRRSPHASDRHR